MASPPLQVTEAACRRIRAVRDADASPEVALRVRAHEEGASFRYELGFVDPGTRAADDLLLDADGIPVLVDARSAPLLSGATLEYVDDISGSGFKIQNPNVPKLLENPLAARVQRVLEETINPSVASHGGRVSLIDVQETRVFVQLGGGCQGCGMANVTLRQGVEEMILREVPEITEVLDVTDHAAGTNPYYAPHG
jgi:Fe/S biogenesis protein NfuA